MPERCSGVPLFRFSRWLRPTRTVSERYRWYAHSSVLNRGAMGWPLWQRVRSCARRASRDPSWFSRRSAETFRQRDEELTPTLGTPAIATGSIQNEPGWAALRSPKGNRAGVPDEESLQWPNARLSPPGRVSALHSADTDAGVTDGTDRSEQRSPRCGAARASCTRRLSSYECIPVSGDLRDPGSFSTA